MLYELIGDAKVSRLSFVGIAKNAGKTTTMNRFIQEALPHRCLGVMSAGVDGESVDALTGLPKPPVIVSKGMWIATAKGALVSCKTRVDIVAKTGISSPLGEIVIACVEEDGPMLIAGVRTMAQMTRIAAEMRMYGAQLVLIDGAFDRAAAASPRVVDALVACTGAVVGNSLDEVVRETEFFLEKLTIPFCDDTLVRSQWSRVTDAGSPVIVGNDKVSLLVPGAFTDRMMVHAQEGISIVVESPSHCVLSSQGWCLLHQKGIRLTCISKAPVIALTVNPFHPYGESLRSAVLVNRLENVASPIPVFDVLDWGEKHGKIES